MPQKKEMGPERAPTAGRRILRPVRKIPYAAEFSNAVVQLRLGGWGHGSGTGIQTGNLSSKAGAGDGLRTRYLDLGKVALYQVSYSRSGRGEIITRPG